MRSRLRYYSVATSLYKDNNRKRSSSLDVHTPDKPLSLCFNLVSEPSSSTPHSVPLLGAPTKLRANAEVSAQKPSLPFPPVFILRRYRLRQDARDKPRTKTRTTPTSVERHSSGDTPTRGGGAQVYAKQGSRVIPCQIQASIDDACMNKPQIKLYFEIWFCSKNIKETL